VRSDLLLLPEDMYKKRKKKKGWHKDFEEERFLLSQFDSMIYKLTGNKIVLEQVVRHSSFYYFLALPKTLITEPYCRVQMGRMIPIVYSWGILGI
jgi:hypothetical protein